MDQAIVCENLSKIVGRFHRVTLVDELCLQLKPGEVCGMLGPNGAGKTTSFKLLLGLARITHGSALIFGKPVPHPSSREGVGFLPEVVNHPQHLTGHEYLRFHADLMGLKEPANRVGEVLKSMEITDYSDRRLGECSKGMRQRIDIARVLLYDPKLVLLDEPVSGLDPLGQHLLRDVLARMKSRGISILINSHAVGILADICDSIGIMNRGKMVLHGSISSLLKPGKSRIRFRMASGREHRKPDASVEEICIDGNIYEWVLPADSEPAPFAAQIFSEGGELLQLTRDRMNLEDLFASTVSAAQETKQ